MDLGIVSKKIESLEQFVIGMVGWQLQSSGSISFFELSVNRFPCKILNTGLEDFQ